MSIKCKCFIYVTIKQNDNMARINKVVIKLNPLMEVDQTTSAYAQKNINQSQKSVS